MRLALIALASVVIAGCCSRQLVARDQMMGRLTVTVDGKGGIVIRHHDGQPKP